MNSLDWEPYFPAGPVIAGLVALLIVLIIIERTKRQRLPVLRIVCLAVMTICLAGLILNPLIVTGKNTRQIMLLTEGFDPDVADSLMAIKKDVEVYRTPDAVDFNGASVATIQEVVAWHGEIVFLLGRGLPPYVLDQFDGSNYKYLPSEKAQGIVALQRNKKFYANRWNRITGTYRSQGAEKVLRLKGPMGVEDSVSIKGAEGSFTFSFYPTAAGTFTYYLEDGNVSEPLFVEILPEQKLNLLLLNTFPTFEQRYLKNTLSKRGHGVAVKSIVSRGKSRTEFANLSPFNLDNIKTETLQKIDLVILDGSAYNALSAAERRAVQKSIEEGLGVLFLPDGTEGKKSTSLVSWKPLRATDTVRVEIERVGKVTLPAIAAEPATVGEVILKGDDERILAGYNLSGAGKVGYIALHETYQLGLQEKQDAYSGLWMPVIERLSREAVQEHELEINTPFPWFEDEPIDFDIISATSETPVVTVDSLRVPLREDANLEQLWSGTMWLDDAAWHTVRIGGDVSKLHLAPKGTWDALRIENQMKATAMLRADVEVEVQKNENRTAGIMPITFLILFAVAAGVLWLAPKL
jgi:hypothetical protein